jgi:hypothetical protein
MPRGRRSTRTFAERALLALIATTALNAAGCSGYGGPDACSLIAGKTFLSLNLMECGLGPNGVVSCNWRVSFTDGTYSWAHSDVVEDGGYSCDGATITTTRPVTSTTPLLGRLDFQTGQLTWDGATYVVQ